MAAIDVRVRARAAAVAGGFTLLEVLVAVLVVAVGLLGMAKLQTVGLSGSKAARARAMVALQAESLAASIIALPAFWGGAGRDFSFSGAQVFVTGSTAALDASADCTATDCTPQDLALFDMARWAAGMEARFPGYAAQVLCDNNAPRECTVRVDWNERVLTVGAATGSASPPPARQRFVLHLLP